jgi:hypothetical protein
MAAPVNQCDDRDRFPSINRSPLPPDRQGNP